MARRAAGTYREVFAVEAPTRTRNAAGGTVETWAEVARIYGSYEALGYSEQSRRGQIGGGISATVYTRYRSDITGEMRLRWVSRDDRLLYISAIVEQGTREDLELTVEEQAT
jgi:SPP1 family predicted phage head-tail adaptor